MFNKDVIAGKWKEIKGDLNKAWGNVSDDEWEKTKGDSSAIAGILQQKYGYAKEEAQQKVTGVFDKHLANAKHHLEKSEDEQSH
jgi:uncharacterized protein YjbJ (UPF0337 family)